MRHSWWSETETRTFESDAGSDDRGGSVLNAPEACCARSSGKCRPSLFCSISSCRGQQTNARVDENEDHL
jgi:hypothetical protein